MFMFIDQLPSLNGYCIFLFIYFFELVNELNTVFNLMRCMTVQFYILLFFVYFEQVEHVRKPRGISFDDTETELHQSRNRRPYFTHQPRSHQVLFSRTASQNRNLDALGCSPDPHKKSRSISKKSLYKPKNVEVG